jgi:hypothetical protein
VRQAVLACVAAAALAVPVPDGVAALAPAAPRPAPAGAPAPPPEPPRTVVAEARGHQGLRATATLRPANAATATEVGLAVDAADDDGSPSVAEVYWGDGSKIVRDDAFYPASCSTPPPPPRPKQPDSYRETLTHAWRHSGPVTVTVVVGTRMTCAFGITYERAVLTLAVDVRPGAVTSNGPGRPFAETFAVRRNHKTGVHGVQGQLRDKDGYVGGAVVDWGDGTTTFVDRYRRPCRDGDGRHFPASWFPFEAEHRYSTPGPHQVTVRYASTGCAGEDPQFENATGIAYTR